jgi:hypothetical protein
MGNNIIDFLAGHGKKPSGVEDDEKVIKITTSGKSALLGGTVSGLEADILETMKSGYPFTLDNLVERLGQRRPWIRTNANQLLKKKYIEVTN